MKHLLIVAVTLPLIACGGATFEAASDISINAGAAGDDGASGAPTQSGGAPSAGKGSVPGAGKPSGGGSAHAGTGGSGGSSAGSAGSGGSQAGTAGNGGASGTATTGGASGKGGSAGTAGAPEAGMAGVGGEPPSPTCTAAQAFAGATLPDAFLMPAWSTTNEGDNVCWHSDDRVCGFSVTEFRMTDATHGRLAMNQISCDKPLYGGTLSDGTCKDMMDCQVFQGSVSDQATVDFVLAPSETSYVASAFEVRAAGSSGGVLGCDLAASTLNEELGARVSDMIAALTFACE